MKLKTALVAIIVIAIIGTIFITGAPTITGQFTQSQQGEIKVGAILPLTGSAATYGPYIGKGMLLAVNEINSDGGINGKQINFLLEDGKCDSKEAVNAANKLITIDNVKVLFTGCSSESLAVAPIANENKVIQMGVITSAAAYSNAGDYSFRSFSPTTYYVGKEAEWAKNKGSKTISLLYEQKEFPTSSAEAFKENFISHGGTIASEQSFPSGEKEFQTYLEKIKRTNSDSIFMAATGESDLLPIINQIYKMNLNDKYTIYSNNVGATVTMNKESKGLNKSIYTVEMYANTNNPKMQEFINNYKTTYNTEINTTLYWVSSAYDVTKLILSIMKKCGEDTECIKQQLYKTTAYQGISGKIGFDMNGDAMPPIAVHYWDGNQTEHWIPIE